MSMEDNMLSKLGFTTQQQEVLEELEKTATDFWNIARESANFLNMLIKVLRGICLMIMGLADFGSITRSIRQNTSMNLYLF